LRSLAQERIAQTWLEPAPAGCHRAGDVADILIIHCEQSTQAIALHRFACAVEAIFPQPIPVDALLPVGADETETRSAASYHTASLIIRSEAIHISFADTDT